MAGPLARPLLCAALVACVIPGAASAATCQDPRGFGAWVSGVAREAVAQRISEPAVMAALYGVTYDPKVVALDRQQGVVKQGFEQFSRRMVPPRLERGQRLMQQHRATLARIERQFGVPPSVLVAIWGLETDFGANVGKLPAIRSVATLAYDCRRSEMFTEQLFAALRVIERGDVKPAEMRGAWAGEIGQTQFMPLSYYRFAVDFDGDGRRDLIRSVPDVLASTANYLKGHGWRPGAGFDVGQPNHDALREWNKGQVYSQTIAYFAGRLSGER